MAGSIRAGRCVCVRTCATQQNKLQFLWERSIRPWVPRCARCIERRGELTVYAGALIRTMEPVVNTKSNTRMQTTTNTSTRISLRNIGHRPSILLNRPNHCAKASELWRHTTHMAHREDGKEGVSVAFACAAQHAIIIRIRRSWYNFKHFRSPQIGKIWFCFSEFVDKGSSKAYVVFVALIMVAWLSSIHIFRKIFFFLLVSEKFPWRILN